MKYSIVGIFGGFILFVTLVFSDSKLYAEGSEKESGWTLGADNKNILYVAHWTHTPENCPGRSAEGAKMLNKFWEGRKRLKKRGSGYLVRMLRLQSMIILSSLRQMTIVQQ